MFTSNDQSTLARLASPLSEAASLSAAVGRQAIAGMSDALNLVNQPALLLDRMGFVLECNAAADALFDDDIRTANRRLVLRGHDARAAFNVLLDRVRLTPDTDALLVKPILVRRHARRPVIIRVLPISGPARSPFLGARVLLTLTELAPRSGPEPRLLSLAFGLTPAEARLASLVATGIAPEEVANRLGISRETARNQLKAVFAKTETHRQPELVALLSTLATAAAEEGIPGRGAWRALVER